MSAAPSNLSLTTDAPDIPDAKAPVIDAAHWIAAREAAPLLDRHIGALLRECKADLAPRGFAVMHNGRWFISRTFDLRLGPGAGPGAESKHHQHPPEFFERCTDKQRREALARVQCVLAFRKARASWSGNQDQWIDRLVEQLKQRHAHITVSVRTLHRWYSAYQTAADIMALVDRRGGAVRGECDPAAWTRFLALFMTGRQMRQKHCWRRVREEAHREGWRWYGSYDALRRAVTRRIPEQDQALARCPEDFRRYYRAFLEQNAEAFAPGECWIGDHAQLDLICSKINSKGKRQHFRPWLTAWMDWRTRRIMGWCLCESPNSTSILAALRAGFTDKNLLTLPSHVWIDNGKDYRCTAIHGQTKRLRKTKVNLEVDEVQTAGVLDTIGIETHLSIPHNPNGKSRLERWFGSLHEHFDKMYASYCGEKESARPEYLNELLNRDANIAPSLDDVKSHLAAHVKGYNACREHDRRDMMDLSPNAMMEKGVQGRRVLADPSALTLLLMMRTEPTTVGKNGVVLSIAGRSYSYGQFAHELKRFKSKTKKNRPPVSLLYDPDDLSGVVVLDKDGRVICVARINAKYGLHNGDEVSTNKLSAAMRKVRKYNKAKKTIVENRDVEYRSALAIAADEDKTPPPPPEARNAPLKPVQTAFDGQPELLEQRKAAGAESYRPNPRIDIYEGEPFVPDCTTDDDADDFDLFDTDDPATLAGEDDNDMDVATVLFGEPS